MEGADNSTVRLDRIEAGRDVKVSTTTTLQIFVGASSREDWTVLAAPDGRVRVERAGSEPASALATDNPYKGLEAFNEADVDRFFGREAVIARLWERCRDLVRPAVDEVPLRLLPVIGPSGCGKSSLIRAGLLPELARRPVPGWGNPRVAVLVPGSHPIDALAAILARMVTGKLQPAKELKEIADLLLADERTLRRNTTFLTGAGRPLIVLVDQFEEVWSLCNSSTERAAFIANLLNAIADRDARVSVVLTLRSDFLGSTTAHPALSQAISRRDFLVPAMGEAELCRAIAEPAKRAGFDFDDATIKLMVSETEGREGALPLLQFALTRIWEGLKTGVSAAETLRRLGGVGGALAKEAERLYEELPDADQRIVRRAFLAQVRLGEGTQDSRRRAGIEEIIAMGEDREHVLAVLRVFSQPGERLITLGSDPSHGAITAELTHEALLDNWKNLRIWIAESRDDLRFQRRVLEAAEDWDAQGRPGGLLWRSPVLDNLREFHRRRAADMTFLEIGFLEASARQQRRERRLRYATGATVFGSMLLVALVLLWLNYASWLDTRPWARLISLSTGTSYPLAHDTANVGRVTPGVEDVKHQVDLQYQPISRIHLGISRGEIVTDWRSLYGTTLNGKWLRYGDSSKLNTGDILVLAGVELLAYCPIGWRPWHYLRPPQFREAAASPSLAVLLDGRRRVALPVRGNEQFVTLRGGSVTLSDKLTEDAVLIVRRRVFCDRRPATHVVQRFGLVEIEGGPCVDEDWRTTTKYNAAIFTSEQYLCPIQDMVPEMTLQPVAAARDRITSWIKEGDRHLRQIVLPSDSETVWIDDNKEGLYGLGQILFETESGPFQVVPTTQAFDVADDAEVCADAR